MISISIIIPVFNEEKTIIKILKKINEIKKSVNFEIVIINDGSTDNTKILIDQNTKYFDKVKHLNKNFPTQHKKFAVLAGFDGG